MLDSLEVVLLVIQVLLVIAGFVWIPMRTARRARRWKAFARELGLRHEGNTLEGEYEGLTMHVRTELRDTGEELGMRCVVRVQVPGALPSGFLAVSREWTPVVGQMPAHTRVSPDDGALNKVLAFQSDVPAEGARLLAVREVREALLALRGRRRQGLVEKGAVAIAHEKDLGNTKELRRCLEAVARAARALAAAESSWRDVSPAQRLKR